MNSVHECNLLSVASSLFCLPRPCQYYGSVHECNLLSVAVLPALVSIMATEYTDLPASTEGIQLYDLPKLDGLDQPPAVSGAAVSVQSPLQVGRDKPQQSVVLHAVWKVAIMVLLVLILLLLVIVLGLVLQMTADECPNVTKQANTTDCMVCTNITVKLDQVLKTTGDSAQQLTNIVSTLSAIEDTSNSTAEVVDDILLKVIQLQNGSNSFSCKDIKSILPSSLSGYYHVNGRYIYCNMGELCGSGGGWTRLAYLNMADSTVNCPPGFRLYQSGGVRACGRPTSSGGSCASVQFPSNGISYSQVCGRVVGYQYGGTDAVSPSFGGHNDLDSWYVDGVSITRGSPRRHVWTLMAGLFESYVHVYAGSNCPCSNGSTQVVQSFIGSNYFCESGNPNTNWQYALYTSDPLWDGQGCGAYETACCAASGLPWFHRDYGNTTTCDYLELRVCGDSETADEDAPVGFYEIYVK